MKYLFCLVISIALLSSCSSGSVKENAQLEQTKKSEVFEPKGHITPKDSLEESPLQSAAIPSLAELSPINIDPRTHSQPRVYSVSAIKVPVNDLLYRLAVDAKMQLDLDSRVSGRVTINAIKQPLDKILQRLAEQVGAVFELTDNTLRVRPDQPYWKSYRIDYVNIIKTVKDASVLSMSVGTVANNNTGGDAQASKFMMDVASEHDFWKSLLANVTLMARQEMTAGTVASADQNVVVNKEAGMISVFTRHKQQAQIEGYLNTILRRSNKQVLIEATVVEVELSDQYQAGVDWSAAKTSATGSSAISQGLLSTNLANDPAFSITLSQVGSLNIDLGIKMLQQFGDAKVLSSPKIMAMNNQSSLLKVVDNQVYFTVTVNTEAATATSAGNTTFQTEVHSIPVGFMMNMTPFISDNDDISLSIRPTLSRIVDYVNDPNPELARQNISSRIPVIQEREMDSVLRLKNKQTAIIGGLIQDVHTEKRIGIPVLGGIPWLGNLFSYQDEVVKKSELIIFIRPVIVNNPDVNYGDLNALKPFMKTRAQ